MNVTYMRERGQIDKKIIEKKARDENCEKWPCGGDEKLHL
jgi:hypothetical protein